MKANRALQRETIDRVCREPTSRVVPTNKRRKWARTGTEAGRRYNVRASGAIQIAGTNRFECYSNERGSLSRTFLSS